MTPLSGDPDHEGHQRRPITWSPFHRHTWSVCGVVTIMEAHMVALRPTMNVHNNLVGWYCYNYSYLQTRKLRLRESNLLPSHSQKVTELGFEPRAVCLRRHNLWAPFPGKCLRMVGPWGCWGTCWPFLPESSDLLTISPSKMLCSLCHFCTAKHNLTPPPPPLFLTGYHPLTLRWSIDAETSPVLKAWNIIKAPMTAVLFFAFLSDVFASNTPFQPPNNP